MGVKQMKLQMSVEMLVGFVIVILFVLYSLNLAVNASNSAATDKSSIYSYVTEAGSYSKEIVQACGCTFIR